MKSFALLLAWALSIPLFAQTSAGTVSGTVRDQSGASIPNAAVTLLNIATNVLVNGATTEAGFYRFPGVIPGQYRITVEFAGMQKSEVNLAVQVGQSVVVDAVLQPAGTATVVDVHAAATMVTTDNATVGAVMERQRIEQLPINGRSLLTLMQQLPGMENQRAYGARHASLEFVLDGSQESERRWGNNPQISLESLQEFRVDVNAVSAKYSRPTNVILSTKSGTNQLHGTAFETARNSAIGVARRRQDFFEKAPPLNRHEYGVGMGGPVVLPGLYNGKDRTFWFANFEGRQQAQSSTASFRVPTMEMRNGDFSNLRDAQGRLIPIYDPQTTDPVTSQRQQFSYQGRLNVIDPARVSPSAKYMFSQTRVPTLNANPLVDVNWFGAIPTGNKQYSVNQRLDHRFSDRDSIFVRTSVADSYGRNLYQAAANQLMLNEIWGREINTEGRMSIATTWIHTFSPSLFNELVLSGSKINWEGGNFNPDGTNYMQLLGVPNPFGVTTEAAPQFTGTGLDGYNFRENQYKQHRTNNWTLDNNATKIFGKHDFQFGGHFRQDRLNILPDQTWKEGMINFDTLATAQYNPASTFENPIPTQLTGHNLANMFLGVANYQNNQNRSWFHLRGGERALYFQDNWRVTPRLNLNLGIRWEYWPTYSEKNGTWTSFNPETKALVLGTDIETFYKTGNSQPSLVGRFQELGMKMESFEQAGLPKNLYSTNKTDFAPRFGFAYRVGDGQKSFVVRGGYSLAYFPIPLWTFVDRMFVNTPMSAGYTYALNNANQSPDGRPNYLLRTVPATILGVNSTDVIDLNKVPGINPGSAQTTYFARSLPTSRLHTWNFTIEKEIMANTVVRARYVGNRGSNLEIYNPYNNNPPDYIWYQTSRQPLPTGITSGVVRRPFDNTFWGNIQEYNKSGWSNYNGFEFDVERRFSNGISFQVFYVVGNALALTTSGNTDTIAMQAVNQFLPGAVPTDYDERNRFLNYQRDPSIPKHRVRWNWVAELPFGRGKPIGKNASGLVDKLIGGWQLAGIGTFRTNYFALPTNHWNITGEPIETYGYKYPIENCTSGTCVPGYLWWNGYIPANRINSVDANGRPNGYMGVPQNYKPAVTPLIPAGTTTLPPNAPANTNIMSHWDTNNVWVPLTNGNAQQVAYNSNLHPWRNQRMPGVNQWGLDASIYKNVLIKERLNIRVGADWFNVLNVAGNPNSIGGDGMLVTRDSGQAARTLQLNARISW